MKKNVLLRALLVLAVFSLLTVGFTGCVPAPPTCTTATVNITTPLDSWWYDIYIDGIYWGTTNSVGNMTLYNVPIGYHNFYAISTDGLYWGNAYPTIVCGINNVAINTY